MWMVCTQELNTSWRCLGGKLAPSLSPVPNPRESQTQWKNMTSGAIHGNLVIILHKATVTTQIKSISVCIYPAGIILLIKTHRAHATAEINKNSDYTGKNSSYLSFHVWLSSLIYTELLINYECMNQLWMQLVVFSGQCWCWIQSFISTPHCISEGELCIKEVVS